MKRIAARRPDCMRYAPHDEFTSEIDAAQFNGESGRPCGCPFSCEGSVARVSGVKRFFEFTFFVTRPPAQRPAGPPAGGESAPPARRPQAAACRLLLHARHCRGRSAAGGRLLPAPANANASVSTGHMIGGTVVLDCGAETCKVGFAGHTSPVRYRRTTPLLLCVYRHSHQ